MKINHVCKENNWIEPAEIKNVRTLILGSFNPFNPNGQNTDYYYGRQSNYFWKVIAMLLGKNENYFTDNLRNKLEVMKDYRFCFLDVIESIEISNAENDDLVNQKFANEHIYTNYFDAKLFTTTHGAANVKVNRNYNQKVFSVIENQDIQRVVHTMGNSTITKQFKTKPKEKSLGMNGFEGYINAIKNTNVEFVPTSYSPSGYAVRRSGVAYLETLKAWINSNLLS
ncbi:hypothetical protein [Croceiramulus getboli]|nr:hypothetical protein P8624_03825 [Flavobacteriaceae bacterium YJPT1-3]